MVLIKIGERLADKTEMIVPRSLLLRSLMTNLSRITVETVNRRCELVVLHSAELSFVEALNNTKAVLAGSDDSLQCRGKPRDDEHE